MIPVLTLIAVLGLTGYLFTKHPKFGKLPSGARKQRIQNSNNFRNNSFQNLQNTPSFAEGESYYSIFKKFISKKNRKPLNRIPSVKTNLHKLDQKEQVVVWFGHSSYYLQSSGNKILVDPVFSGSASPIPSGTKAFRGTDVYGIQDMPIIDYLFITHDHWDHLDYETVVELKPKIKKVITGLGTGAHFEAWGFDPNILIEMDWNDKIIPDKGFIVSAMPARHFSGRTLKRNTSLWCSFVLQTPDLKIFIGGDSGYGNHFSEIGKTFGPFDLAILENGQYNKSWPYIHMMPEEVLKAAENLQTKKLLPVHHSKFALSLHPWDEPLRKITSLPSHNLQLCTPMIGEKLLLNKDFQVNNKWWEDVRNN